MVILLTFEKNMVVDHIHSWRACLCELL